MSTGTAVRLSSSGLCCPRLAPVQCGGHRGQQERRQTLLNTWIEFGNRLLNFRLVIITVIVFVAACRFRSGGTRQRDLIWLAAIQPAEVIAQVAIGGIVVLIELNPATASIYFLVSASTVATLVVLYVRCTEGTGPLAAVVRGARTCCPRRR